MNREKIIKKIENLFELAKDNSSENESHAALAMAQKLMMKYKIEESELEQIKKKDIVEEYYKLKKGLWRRYLLKEIAINFLCDAYLKGRLAMIVGKSQDIEFVKMMYEFAEKQLLSTFQFFLKQNYDLPIRLKIKNEILRSYAIGFINGLHEKLECQKKENIQKWEIILCDNSITEYMEEKTLNSAKKPTQDIDPFIAAAGYRNGKNMKDYKKVGGV